MSFDPSGMTVKEAAKALGGLSDGELEAIYNAELDGKGRKALLDNITDKRDDLREAAVEVAPEPEAAPEQEAPAPSNRRFVDVPARRGRGAARYVIIEEGS